MNSIGTFGPAFALFTLGFMPPDLAAIETLLIIAVGINAAIWCGFQVNHVDLSPKFGGILMGISNGSAQIFSFIAPLFVQLIVPDEHQDDQSLWRIIFIIASAVYILSDIFYLFFAEAELQPWNNLGDEPTDVNSNSTVPVDGTDVEKKS